MWEPLLASSLLLGSLVWSAIHFQRGRLYAWKQAVFLCRLELEEASGPLSLALGIRARSGPLQVRIQASERGRGHSQVRVTVPGPPGFGGVRIRREASVLRKTREIESGDEAFDQKFFIEGPLRLVSVLLDAEVRNLLLRLNAAGVLEIARGELKADLRDDELLESLRLLLEIGRRFAQPVNAAQRLAENVRQDPEAGVRLRNLLLLVREYPGEPGAVEALRAACTDPSPRVRLWAATELRAEGLPILIELAQSTEDDTVSAQAVSAAGGELPFESMRAILENALRRRRLQTARACLEVLGRRGGDPAIAALAKVMALEKSELALAAAQALGTTGSAAAEPPLILALQGVRADLRIVAANALGRAGSVAAVLPLKDAAERFLRDQELQRATRQAIAEIQARLPGASPGQLSLAGDEQGQLSLVQAEVGQLSFTTDPEGLNS